MDVRPLVSEPLPGAADAALHLVEHEQPAAFIADAAHGTQVVDRRRVDSAFALDDLQKNRRHVGVRLCDSLDRVDVVERHTDEALNQRAKSRLDFRVAGGR